MTRSEGASTDSASRSDRASVFVVIPAYNEGGAIGDVVRDVRTLYPNVVVIDDGSTDDTCRVAARHATFLLRHVVNRGQGAALQTGLEFALSRGAQIIVTFDADGQHRVDEIAAMIAPIEAGSCDITLGSRFLGDSTGIPLSRRLLLKAAVLFTRMTGRIKVTDAHNGFRAFSQAAAQKIDITLDRMAHASELMDQIRESRMRYLEIPVRIRYTEYSLAKGQSARGAFRIVVHYILGKVLQ